MSTGSSEIELQDKETTTKQTEVEDTDEIVVKAEVVPFLSAESGDNVPPGAPSGGEWGRMSYVGGSTKVCVCITCLVCGLPGLCVIYFMDPAFDERIAYKAGGKIYDSSGKYVASSKKYPERFRPIKQLAMGDRK